MLDNGAYTLWRRNTQRSTPLSWDAYYVLCREWLEYRTTWAVIPDVIDGSERDNDRLIAEWFAKMGSYRQAAPVWHLSESIDRLIRLTRTFDRVCIGSSGDYAVIGNDRWNNRMNDTFNSICKGSGSPDCWLHMLRGMSLSGSIYPFSSVDSTDIARNHHLPNKEPVDMARRWDAIQNPAKWIEQPVQLEWEAAP